jgi:hypothetical protein
MALLALSPRTAAWGADKLNVSGDFDFEWTANKLGLKARDVTIQGLSLPALSWGWIGMAIAQGVLSGFGSMLFQAIVGAANSQGTNLAELLRAQLVEFARIVDQALKADALREYEATLLAYVRLFEEYANDPTNARLDFLLNESAVILSKIESLGFLGYRTYMATAGLRLAVLQERAKGSGNGLKVNFTRQRAAAIDYHRSMITVISRSVDPQNAVAGLNDQWEGHEQSPLKSVFIPSILGQPVRHRIYRIGEKQLAFAECSNLGTFSYPVVIQRPFPQLPQITTAHERLDCADLAAVGVELRRESTDIGEKIVERWLKAPGRVAERVRRARGQL